jgi:hypothetical protein
LHTHRLSHFHLAKWLPSGNTFSQLRNAPTAAVPWLDTLRRRHKANPPVSPGIVLKCHAAVRVSANVPISGMMEFSGITALLLSLALAANSRLEAQASDIDMCPVPNVNSDIGQETIEAPGLPNLGKWMLDHSGSPAHWLGEIYQGKKLREPINVVIVDTQATSVDDAKERFVEASARAGYTIRIGHSSGYRGAHSR